jgi:hypothetical protein
MPENRQYKDSVFTLLFSDPDKLRELYNAIEGSSYGKETAISINTLQNVLFMERNNDISFTIDNKLVILLEHQSTVNPNMPLRFLFYISRIYEKLIDLKSIYRKILLPIPAPEFIVLYNGKTPQPDEVTLRLSDSFITRAHTGMDLAVRVLNVNAGHNRKILQKSRTLEEYAQFIARVREYEKRDGLEESLKKAVKYSIKKGILKWFLKEHASEVVNMIFTEWNWDDAREVWEEEAKAQGIQIGEARGEARGIEIGESRGEAKVLELLKAQGYDTGKLENMLKDKSAE